MELEMSFARNSQMFWIICGKQLQHHLSVGDKGLTGRRYLFSLFSESLVFSSFTSWRFSEWVLWPGQLALDCH